MRLNKIIICILTNFIILSFTCNSVFALESSPRRKFARSGLLIALQMFLILQPLVLI